LEAKKIIYCKSLSSYTDTFVLETKHSDTRNHHCKVTSAPDTHRLLTPGVQVGEVHHHPLCLRVPDDQKICRGTSPS